PSEEDGNDTILMPRNFRIAVAYRLGVCKQTIDQSGDHATCCTHSGDLIVRHNAVRNFVNRVATDALLSPLEKRGILGETSGDARGTSPYRCGPQARAWPSTSPSPARWP